MGPFMVIGLIAGGEAIRLVSWYDHSRIIVLNWGGERFRKGWRRIDEGELS
jgi:hypothetical protein